MLKSNVRSFRYSDEVAALIEASEGENFSEKFSNLVLGAYAELPAAQKELTNVQSSIEQERKKLMKLNRELMSLEGVKRKMEQIERYFEYVESDLKQAGFQAND